MDDKILTGLHIHPDILEKEEERRFWTDLGAGAAGAAAGGGLGTLAIRPYEYYQQHQADKEASQAIEEFQLRQEQLRALDDLYTGRMKFRDIDPEHQLEWARMRRENLDFLRDRQAVREALNELPPASVSPDFGHFNWRKLLPDMDMVRKPIQTLAHPIPFTAGLLGSIGARYMMDRHNQRRFYDEIEQMHHGQGGEPT